LRNRGMVPSTFAGRFAWLANVSADLAI